MDKKDLDNSPELPPSNKELNKNKYHFNYYYIIENVPEEYNKLVLVNYRGHIAPKVIDYILKHGGFTIPTLSSLFGVSYQTIEHILKRLRPWVIQTRHKLEHPITRAGNKARVWVRNSVDPLEGVNEARTSYYKTLEKNDQDFRNHVDLLKSVNELGRDFLENVVRDRSEVTNREILIYLKEKFGQSPQIPKLADMVADMVARSGVKVWR